MIMLTFMVMNLEKMLTLALSFCLYFHFTIQNLLMKTTSRLIGPKMPPIRWQMI